MTEQDQADIRRSYREAAFPQKQISILADLYLCSRGEIREIVGLGDKIEKSSRAGKKMDMEKVKKALWMRATGNTLAATAKELGVSATTVQNWEREYA